MSDTYSIKLHGTTYDALVAQMRARETFDQAVSRLLAELLDARARLQRRARRKGGQAQ